MNIWKNTSTLDGFDLGLNFTKSKNNAEIILLGSKIFDLDEFPKLKAVFRAGVGKENVPEIEARNKGIIVRFPSKETMNVLFEETAHYTCGLILRMLYSNIGSIEPWLKESRRKLSTKKLLVIGTGNIGNRVISLMNNFMTVMTFDILKNRNSQLKPLMEQADCVSIHIPMNDHNLSFINGEKLSWMKEGSTIINTARGAIIDENALYLEIKNNRLKAAFDVYWDEPYVGKLKEFHPDKFLMTPHVASTCDEFLIGCRKDLDVLIKEFD
ncbi:MAG: hydroxyacid dehydrogenase [Candidatus Marinimicrobia bacterium]|nr:hydroxyacid dehydrogenase [Candidatus Neomarinimicrobiota bacterium]|tara:strand:+ start:71965 stop:72771 length:807 start_codon:yes stop_codon:yes gene_type:complete